MCRPKLRFGYFNAVLSRHGPLSLPYCSCDLMLASVRPSRLQAPLLRRLCSPHTRSTAISRRAHNPRLIRLCSFFHAKSGGAHEDHSVGRDRLSLRIMLVDDPDSSAFRRDHSLHHCGAASILQRDQGPEILESKPTGHTARAHLQSAAQLLSPHRSWRGRSTRSSARTQRRAADQPRQGRGRNSAHAARRTGVGVVIAEEESASPSSARWMRSGASSSTPRPSQRQAKAPADATRPPCSTGADRGGQAEDQVGAAGRLANSSRAARWISP